MQTEWMDSTTGEVSYKIINNYELTVFIRRKVIMMAYGVQCTVRDKNTRDLIRSKKIVWTDYEHRKNDQNALERGKDMAEMEVSILEILSED